MSLTGNPRPPRRFDGPADLERFVARKAYRGILGFSDVRIRPPRGEEDQYQGEARRIRAVGYTPVAPGLHSLGEGALITTNAKGNDLDFIDLGDDLEFRVGERMNRLHQRATGHLLPFAGMDIQYQCGYEGKYTIAISSTNIPNVTVYVDWIAVEDYSIREITVEQVEDFLTAFSRRSVAQFVDRFVIEGTVGQPPTVRPGGVDFIPMDEG